MWYRYFKLWRVCVRILDNVIFFSLVIFFVIGKRVYGVLMFIWEVGDKYGVFDFKSILDIGIV